MARPKTLLVSPVVPASTGGGLAMRAWLTLQQLAAHNDTQLLVLDLAWANSSVGPEVRRLTTRIVHVDLAEGRRWRRRSSSGPGAIPIELQYLSASIDDEISGHFQDERFDCLHLFRLYMAPYVVHLRRGHRGRVHLDLDDIESLSRQRLSALYALGGRARQAEAARRDSEYYERLEREFLPAFDRVYVCSQEDRARLQDLYHLDTVAVFPNAVSPDGNSAWKTPGDPFVLLLPGMLGHYPNEDAVRFFCTDVLPLVMKATRTAIEVAIIGGRPSLALKWRCGHRREVRWLGYVPDPGVHFTRADAVVVPLRAGGGTRIKILEAFAHSRPVVATTIGLEGIVAVDGRDVLVADSAVDLAAQIIRLIENPSLSRAIAEGGFRLLCSRYTAERIHPGLLGVGPPVGNRR